MARRSGVNRQMLTRSTPRVRAATSTSLPEDGGEVGAGEDLGVGQRHQRGLLAAETVERLPQFVLRLPPLPVLPPLDLLPQRRRRSGCRSAGDRASAFRQVGLQSRRHLRPDLRGADDLRAVSPGCSTSVSASPANGGRPVRISYRIAPSPKMSVAGPIRSSRPSACSGAMYAGVPTTWPIIVRPATGSAGGSGSTAVAVLVRLVQPLGQAPVQHDRLAELAQDDVLALQVAMDDAVRVGVGDGVADGHEGGEQTHQLHRLVPVGPPVAVEGRGHLGQRSPANEAHDVERPTGLGIAAQLVHRHDAGVFELPGDPRLANEPARRTGRPRPRSSLSGHVPADGTIPREPHMPHPARGVQRRPRVPRAGRKLFDGYKARAPSGSAVVAIGSCSGTGAGELATVLSAPPSWEAIVTGLTPLLTDSTR